MVGRKGQAFTTFKILIGAVLAVSLLVIIYVATSHTQIPYNSHEAIKDLMRQAQNGLGLCFAKENVYFVSGEDLTALHIPLSNIIDNVGITNGKGLVEKTITTSASVMCTAASADKCKVWLNSQNCK